MPSLPTTTTTDKREELTATFRRIVWPQDRVDGRQFLIITVDVDDGKQTVQKSVKGEADPDDLIPGINYKFFGRWGKPKGKYEAAFEFSQVVRQEPHSRGGMVHYLAKYAAGIGPATAAKLWDAFSGEAAKILRTRPDAILERFPGLSKDMIFAASQSLESLAKTEDTRIELATLFEGRGFPAKMIDDVIRLWGINAPRIIRHDPFKLLVNRFAGAGFARCDRLYMDLGLPPARLKRQFACIWRKLQEDTSGHTWFPVSTAKAAIAEHISGIDAEQVDWQRAVKLGVRAGWLKLFQDQNKTWWISERRKAESESRLADAITRIMQAKPIFRWPNADAIEGATTHQRDVARTIFREPIAILGGSPGTGKTTFTAMILGEMRKAMSAHQIAVVAPTNAAAVRIGNSLKARGLDGISCGTVHGTLGVVKSGRDKSGWGFWHTKDNPLPFNLIAIDEASMESADDAADLFEAIPSGALVLVIGDHHQLMPVSHGAPLRDMRAAGIPHAELTEVLRNGGDGLEACRAIRDGRPAKPSQKIDIVRGANWKHWNAGNGKQSLHLLKQIVTKMSGLEVPETDIKPAFTVDPIRDVQVIVALNEKGDANRKAVNELLQQTLNPHGEQVDGVKFRCGDKIIAADKIVLQDVTCEVWDFNPDNENDGQPSSLIVKGEIGFVSHVMKAGVIAEFSGPPRRVFIPRRGDKSSPLDSFELGYAITFHKSQGSQWPIVLLLIDRAANRVACRELWYVGTSRFEVMLCTIGELAVMHQQCRRIALADRKTFLAERLAKFLGSKDAIDE